MNKALKISLLIVIVLLIILFLLRLISPREIDDVNPFRSCEEVYLKKSDIFWVIPYYQEKPISENKTWCEEILSMNKTLGLHGYTHEYKEFKNKEITPENLTNAIKIFEECFGYSPQMFKAPHLALSKENKKLLKENKLKIKNPFHQTIHKVYHCSDSGTLPNRFHNLF
mgnify:CR=1 FL=1